MPTLEIDHLNKTFGSGDSAVRALTDMTFTVRPGEVYGFVGSNGAGKSTAMRIALGVLTSDTGEARVDGTPINDDIRRTIGYMPEERGLYDKEKIADQLIFFGRLHGLTKQAATTATDELLEQLGLTERANSKLQELSLGNQQRVQLAASLVHHPELLILDEPFSGLDPEAVDEMFAVLTEFTRRGVPVLFSSHQLDLVERLCDQIVILRKGQVVAAGSVAELRTAGETQHRIEAGADLGWLRGTPGVTVIDLDGPEAVVAFADEQSTQATLAEAMRRGPVHSFGPIVRPLSDYYREVTR